MPTKLEVCHDIIYCYLSYPTLILSLLVLIDANSGNVYKVYVNQYHMCF